MSRWAKITNAGKDDKQYPVQQSSWFGRLVDAFIMFPYGMHANLPAGQLALIIDKEGRVLMGTSAIGRIQVLEGEVVFYHPPTGSNTHYLTNGDIVMTPKAGQKVIIDSDATITQNLSIEGDLDVTGATALSATVTSNGKDISDTHTHSGVTTGSGSTGVPN